MFLPTQQHRGPRIPEASQPPINNANEK
jgi:hypothetical protein